MSGPWRAMQQPWPTAHVHAAGEAIVRASVEAGGVLSGEHGIGLEKRDFMHLMFEPADLAAQALGKLVRFVLLFLRTDDVGGVHGCIIRYSRCDRRQRRGFGRSRRGPRL